jgi:predicted RNA polymerase sigma factor
VLEVVYLIFNEGYTAARGREWQRPQLCNEALRMGRVLTAIAPHEPETHGLLALMELNASRTVARTDAAGEPILMLDQNRALWDQLQIRQGTQALERVCELGGAGGSYALQAAIIACRASPYFTQSWARSHARRSSSSTARLPSAWPKAQKWRWR